MGLPRYDQLWLHFNWFLLVPHFEDILLQWITLCLGTDDNLNFRGPPPSLHHRHPSETTASSHSTRAASVIERAIFGGGRCGVSKRFQKDGFGGFKAKKEKRSSKSKRFKYQDKPRMIHKNFGQFSKLSSGLSSKIQGFSGFQAPENPKSTSLSSSMLFFFSLIAPSSSMDVDARKWCGSFHLRKKDKFNLRIQLKRPLLPCCLALI